MRNDAHTRLQRSKAAPQTRRLASFAWCAVLFAGLALFGFAQDMSAQAPAQVNPSLDPPPQPTMPAAQPAAAVQDPNPSPAPDVAQPASTPDDPAVTARPIAIVPLDSKIAGAAAEVTGGMKVFNGRAFIATDGAISAGDHTAQVTLPYRGTLRVCANSVVKLTSDASIPAGDVPGLLMAMDHGAVEASFATGRNSDILMTPDFRILIGGPGAAEVKVRLGAHGDTCVDNAGVNAPYVLVSSVFEGGAYRVQAGQRVMFQHGNLHEVVDHEKEPCGCPPDAVNGNEFPLAQSEGIAPTLHPAPAPAGPVGQPAEGTGALIYNGAEHAPKPDAKAEVNAAAAAPPPVDAPATPPPGPPTPAPEKKKPGFFKRMGHFFKKVFGAD